MISCITSLAIGFFLALIALTIYAKFKKTDCDVQTGDCKMCGGKNTILRSFTPFMIEHYCPDCRITFFKER
tara:strand:+ start:792 stop:1004 length:213 start_codon:yes stop_codon:yes gene_type:complete